MDVKVEEGICKVKQLINQIITTYENDQLFTKKSLKQDKT